MRPTVSPAFLFLIIACAAADASSSSGTYDDPALFFSVRDTSRAVLVVRQTELERDDGRAGYLVAECNLSLGSRSELRLALPLAVLESERSLRDIVFGLGDAGVRLSTRLAGDTLGTSGLYARLDARLPTGSRDLRPFASASLDGGAGVELRFRGALFDVRGAILYTLVGDRVADGSFTNRNHATAAARMDIPAGKRTSFSFLGIVVRDSGGATRELYQVSLSLDISTLLSLSAAGALEAGSDDARIFNSAVSIGLRYRFPPAVHGESSGQGPMHSAN